MPEGLSGSIGGRLYLTVLAATVIWALAIAVVGAQEVFPPPAPMPSPTQGERYMADPSGRVVVLRVDEAEASRLLGFTPASVADAATYYHDEAARMHARRPGEIAFWTALALGPFVALVALRKWWRWLVGAQRAQGGA